MADNNTNNADYAVKITADLSGLNAGLKEGEKNVKTFMTSLNRANDRWLEFSKSGAQSLKIVDDALDKNRKAVDNTISHYREMFSATKDVSKAISETTAESQQLVNASGKVVDSVKNITKEYKNTSKVLAEVKSENPKVVASNNKTAESVKNITEEYKEAGKAASDFHDLVINRGDISYNLKSNGEREFLKGTEESLTGKIDKQVSDTSENIKQKLNKAVDDAGKGIKTKSTEIANNIKESTNKVADNVKNVNEAFSNLGHSEVSDDSDMKFYKMSNAVDDVIQESSILQALLNKLKIPDSISDKLKSVGNIAKSVSIIWERFTFKPEKLSEEAKVIQNEIDAIVQKMHDLEQQQVPTDQYRWYQNEIKIAKEELSKLIDKEADWDAKGVKHTSQKWKDLQAEIDIAKRKIHEYEIEMADMEDEGMAFMSGKFTPDYSALSQHLDELKVSLEEVKSETETDLEDIEGEGESVASRIGRSFKENFGAVATTALKAFQNAFNFTVKSIATGFKTAINGIKSFISHIKDMKIHTDTLDSVVKKVHKTFTSFISLLKTRLKRMFISSVINDMKEAVGNIARQSGDFNNAISGMIVSCKTFGAQLVAMAEPIVTVVAPYVSKLVDMLTAGADKLSQFTARLTGKDTYTKVQKGQFDYAKSLDKTAKSTENAEKAVKKYQNTVLSFDQLHKLNGKEDGSTSIKTPSDITGVSDTVLTKAKTQASKLNDIADRIRKALQEGRYRDAGVEVGKAITGAFSWLDNVAGWEKNCERITAALQHVIDFINGIKDGLDADVIGHSIGDVINTIIHSFELLTDPDNGIDFMGWGAKIGAILLKAIQTIHWRDLGKTIVQGIQSVVRFINGVISTDGLFTELGKAFSNALGGAIEAFDPHLWADTIVKLINGIADFITNAFDNTDGKFNQLGEKLAQMINEIFTGIDDSKLSAAAESLKTAFQALFSSLWDNLDKQAIGEKIQGWLEQIPWLAIFTGAFAIGVLPSLSTVLTSSGDSLLVKLLTGIPKLLMELATKLPGMIMSILGNPIALSMVAIGALIFGSIATHFEQFKQTLQNAWDYISDKIDIAKEHFQSGVDKIRDAIDTLQPVFDELWTHLEPLFTSIGEFIGDAIEDLSRLWDEVLAPIVAWIIKDVVPVLTPIIGWFIDTIKLIIDLVKDFGNDFTDILSGLVEFISGVFSGDWEKAWDGLWNIVKGGVNLVLHAIEGFFNFFVDGINAVIGVINKLNITVPDWVPGIGGKSFGLDVPYVPHVDLPELKTGGVVGDGQVFIANEGGNAELIGGDNGKTVVVNNEQIVNSIVRGVREAVADVMMSNTNNSESNRDLVIFVDGEELARASMRGQAKLDKRTNPVISFS